MISLNQVFSFRSRASGKAYLENRYFKREQKQNNFSFDVNSALTINFRGWDGRFGRRFSILRVKWPIFSTTDIFASNCLPVNFSKQKWETIFRKKISTFQLWKKKVRKNGEKQIVVYYFFFVKRKHHVGFRDETTYSIAQTKILVFDLKRHPHKFLSLEICQAIFIWSQIKMYI